MKPANPSSISEKSFSLFINSKQSNMQNINHNSESSGFKS